MGAATPDETITDAGLNRALLARQHLLARTDASDVTPVAMVEHLVGLQAQAPWAPYYQLASRLAGFAPDDLGRLLLDREVVRIPLMRGTVHLVTPADAGLLYPLTNPVLARFLTVPGERATAIAGLDPAELAAYARELVEAEPRADAELAPLLAERFPGRPPKGLTGCLTALLPLVQVPPRAAWGRTGKSRWTTLEAWTGVRADPAASAEAAETVVRRYLAAFGPATVADVQHWCRLTGLGEVVARLRPELVELRHADGRTLYDLPDAPRPDADVPAPVRFVGEFDNLLLSHADRTRVISDEHRRRVFTNNGIIRSTILVDGRVAGLWRLERAKAAATLHVTPFARLPRRVVAALTTEGRRLLAFAAAGAETTDVRFAEPG